MRLKEIKPGMVIHCTTKDEVLLLLEMFPTRILTIGLWERFENKTCLRVEENRTLSFDEYDYFIQKGYKIAEFSDLIIPELSAKEVLETIGEICSLRKCCVGEDGCPLYISGSQNLCSNKMLLAESEKVIDICTTWREEHPKEEKKELETEWVDVVRIIKVHTNGKKECVHEALVGVDTLNLNDFAEAELKHYCSNHKGKFFANLNCICRIKE